MCHFKHWNSVYWHYLVGDESKAETAALAVRFESVQMRVYLCMRNIDELLLGLVVFPSS